MSQLSHCASQIHGCQPNLSWDSPSLVVCVLAASRISGYHHIGSLHLPQHRGHGARVTMLNCGGCFAWANHLRNKALHFPNFFINSLGTQLACSNSLQVYSRPSLALTEPTPEDDVLHRCLALSLVVGCRCSACSGVHCSSGVQQRGSRQRRKHNYCVTVAAPGNRMKSAFIDLRSLRT